MTVVKQYFKSRILPITIFGIAMGFMEAVIVVYLRELYFPDGFRFPLILPDKHLIVIAELIREVATLLMLLTLAIVAGKSFYSWFAWFLFSFAVWDIFYYLGLKFFLDWPASWFTWDILFLIPVTWIGPVFAPIISSALMIVLGYSFLFAEEKRAKINLIDWAMILLGAFLIFFTFVFDFSQIIFQNGLFGDFFNLLDNSKYLGLVSGFVPEYYNWPLFAAGTFSIMIAIFRIFRYKK